MPKPLTAVQSMAKAQAAPARPRGAELDKVSRAGLSLVPQSSVQLFRRVLFSTLPAANCGDSRPAPGRHRRRASQASAVAQRPGESREGLVDPGGDAYSTG